jgi:hypothetical protein
VVAMAQEQDSVKYKLSKSRFFITPTFSLSYKNTENEQQLLQLVNNQNFLQYSVDLNAGYFIADDFAAGLLLRYENTREEINFTADNKETFEQSAKNSVNIAPNIRNYFGNRFKIFNQTSLAFICEKGLRRVTVDDEVDKYDSKTLGLSLGIQPGIAFFIDRAVSVEAYIELLGLETKVRETVKNDSEESRVVTSSIDFSISVLSLNLGLGFYLNELHGKKQRRAEKRGK